MLLSCCIGVHPSVKRHFTSAGGLYELTKSTNVLLGATNRRVIVMATGAGGGPRDHASIPRAGLGRRPADAGAGPAARRDRGVVARSGLGHRAGVSDDRES